ncbi:hypothetical protein LguiB_018537 [Lonicera macranthoides]
MAHISDIKLIRTDTTLDLSQKAEKGMLFNVSSSSFYRGIGQHSFLSHRCGAARTQAPSATNYDVGSTTWVDLRRAPFLSAMEMA